MKMRVVQFHEYGDRTVLRYEDVTAPEPMPHEAIVEVRACGVNRVDILSREGQTPIPVPLPHTSGTEVAGVISSAGREIADEWQVGTAVLINPTLSCGHCEPCREGRDNRCRNGRIFGVQTLGGYAEFVAAPAEHLLRIPEGMGFQEAAAVAVTGSTAYHMLFTRGELSVGESVLIVAGGSGIGVLGIQMAKHAGARVLVTAGSEAKLSAARELGADETINHADPDWGHRVRELTGGRGVDLVFEHVGEATWGQSLKSLARGGRLVTCGGHSGFKVTIDLWQLFIKEQMLVGSYAGTRRDLERVLDLVSQGVVRPVIDRVLRLRDAATAQELMEDRQVFGKVLLVP